MLDRARVDSCHTRGNKSLLVQGLGPHFPTAAAVLVKHLVKSKLNTGLLTLVNMPVCKHVYYLLIILIIYHLL